MCLAGQRAPGRGSPRLGMGRVDKRSAAPPFRSASARGRPDPGPGGSGARPADDSRAADLRLRDAPPKPRGSGRGWRSLRGRSSCGRAARPQRVGGPGGRGAGCLRVVSGISAAGARRARRCAGSARAGGSRGAGSTGRRPAGGAAQPGRSADRITGKKCPFDHRPNQLSPATSPCTPRSTSRKKLLRSISASSPARIST